MIGRNKNDTTEYFIDGRISIRKDLNQEKIAEHRSNLKFLICVGLILILMLAISLLNTFVFFSVQVKGQSMENTLYTGDYLIANRVKDIERGSIVIIKGENKTDDSWLIKRVIGLPGERVKIQGGYVYLSKDDGATWSKLNEPYLTKQGVTDTTQSDGKTEWIIGEEEYFYLGDNRENSSDSRYKYYDVCDREQIVGVVENWSLSVANFFRAFKR
ncbi:MAG: signal peptidase I [Clostridia bacterium]|nr:signal peptidase I [Clostridia bacterium]